MYALLSSIFMNTPLNFSHYIVLLREKHDEYIELDLIIEFSSTLKLSHYRVLLREKLDRVQ